MEVLDSVLGPDPGAFILWHIGIELVEEGAAVRPFTFDVREIGSEHDPIHPDMMPQFYGHPLVLYAPGDVLSGVLAGTALDGFEAQEIFSPAMVPLEPQIRTLQPERHPAETCLRHKHFQRRKTIKNAGENQLRHTERRGQAEIRHPFQEGAAD